MENIKQGFIIPVYNHGMSLQSVVDSLVDFNLPIIVVDDGNPKDEKVFLDLISQKYLNVVIVENGRNRGKGYSVCKGIEVAKKMGITHLFQIDADGQHDRSRCAKFLELSKNNPDALICGQPVFDESIPKERLEGRKISNNYASFVTLTKGYIKDAMCGYRIYPVEAFYNINRFSYIDSHMAFDTEILIRFVWKNIPIIFSPVSVCYPEDGKSNFRMIRDNIRISFMFARMTIGMWLRYPMLNKRRKNAEKENSAN